ncbi:MAG TPA: fasciclin domain-containing protein [Capillimicrobium sp.]|jgi:uncharacterized surface protein with fasciclin (FAS1) repeats
MLTRITAVLAAAAALAVAPAAATAQSGNLVETAQSAGSFSTLVKLVEQAGLAETLSGNDELTVLAPTDKAFSKVPKKTLNALANDRAMLRKVLLYHVIPGSVPSSEIVELRSAKTAEGSKVKIRVRGKNVFVNDAKVTQTDVEATNGVIHVINRVLLPPM